MLLVCSTITQSHGTYDVTHGQKQSRLGLLARWPPRKQTLLRFWPPDVPNAAVSSPANPVAAGVAALGSGTVETKGMTNSITRGVKARRRVKARVSRCKTVYVTQPA